jgi:predicted AlkP superfamily pyrophosphatase or phosphodiesterase
MPAKLPRLVVIDTVGLTARWLAYAPRLAALAQSGWSRALQEVVPAVTCTAQAAVLTGVDTRLHGIVGNGWLWRDTGEIRFWQQSNRLLQAPPLYTQLKSLAASQGRSFRCAKLFWWFNQGAAVDWSVTPKPWYGADGNKIFGITGTPEGLTERLERELGPFPFQTFWGPMAGLPSSNWIARCAAWLLQQERPDLLLVYLPHLDYGPQRLGPTAPLMKKIVGELDNACEPLLSAARSAGARVWVVNEYGHVPVRQPVLINRELRRADLLKVRSGPFGETMEPFTSQAFAVCDHQVAHVYVNDEADIPKVRDRLAAIPGIARVLSGEERAEYALDHSRSGELVALAAADSWFAYPYWLDDRQAPDFARTVDIHRKPGYDPCELFFDPKLRWPKGRALLRLLQKKLGLRTLFDVVPLDPSLVRGSHGLQARDPLDRPILIADGPSPSEAVLPMQAVHDLVLQACHGPQ